MIEAMDVPGERQPLLQKTPEIVGDELSEIVVDFDPNGDAANPMEWPSLYKWFIVALLALMAFTVTFTCISVVPVANTIITDLSPGHGSKSSSVLLVTIWELGEAAGPLLIAPLSELVGRRPVMHGANVVFVAATVLAALAPSVPLLIGARCLTGLAVASNVLNPAIVGDMFASEQRGTAMSMVMLTPLLGGAVGPALSGAIAERWGWRAFLALSAVLAGACELAFLAGFRETYRVTILARRAREVRRTAGPRTVVRTVHDADDAGQRKKRAWESVMRPAIVLWSSGVLQIVSLVGGVVYAYFYIMSTSLPDILEGVYDLSPTECGFAFMCFSAGSIIGIIICNMSLDALYIRLRDRNNGVGLPEYRLPITIVGVFLFPIAVALYGWIPQERYPLPAELTMTGCWGFCLLTAELPLMAYIVDAFSLHSASAMTAMIVIRCLMGTFLPMAVNPLVQKFGWGWGMTFFAGISLILAPVTIVVMRYGKRWRQRSVYSRDVIQ